MNKHRDAVRRPVICPGYDRVIGEESYHVDCGNDVYEATYSDNNTPIWKCWNCRRETPRRTRTRKSNRVLALEAWEAIKTEWKPTDDALQMLLDAGKIRSGALMVHESTLGCYHLRQLLESAKLTNWELRYHIDGARKDLERAKAYLEEFEMGATQPSQNLKRMVG